MPATKEHALQERLLNNIRYFNRRFFNPFALSFAGRTNSFWSVILHTGRRSGKAYLTPVVAVRQDGCFVIPLPYGRQVDWFKNVMAARGCGLIYHGKVYNAGEPEMIPLEEGVGAFAGWVQARLRRGDTQYLLRLNQISAAPDGETQYQSFIITYPLSHGLLVLAAVGFVVIGIGRRIAQRK
jgi:deazaflavin-dependent oxidoreductase (nitroreductase family)